MQNFVDQPRIRPDKKFEVFVVLDHICFAGLNLSIFLALEAMAQG